MKRVCSVLLVSIILGSCVFGAGCVVMDWIKKAAVVTTVATEAVPPATPELAMVRLSLLVASGVLNLIVGAAAAVKAKQASTVAQEKEKIVEVKTSTDEAVRLLCDFIDEARDNPKLKPSVEKMLEKLAEAKDLADGPTKVLWDLLDTIRKREDVA